MERLTTRVLRRLGRLKDDARRSFSTVSVNDEDVPGQPVETFLATAGQGADTPSLQIFGDPMHKSRKKLLQEYGQQPLEDYLAAEARNGIGNYVLLDQSGDGLRIVTAPGYCGGYFCARDGRFVAGSTLSAVLSDLPGTVEMDPFGICFWFSYAPQSNFNQMPFTTVFKDVFRLVPGAVLEMRNGRVIENYSYLSRPSPLKKPISFESAFKDVMAQLARYYGSRGTNKIGVMFSGGVDSLLIYLGLRWKMGVERIRNFSVEFSGSNGPSRAVPVSNQLDIDLEILPETTWDRPEVQAGIIDMMRQEVISARSVHLALLGQDLTDTDLLHGQNMDALVNTNMTILHANHELGFLSRAKTRSIKTKAEKVLQYEAFLTNLQFTDAFLEDPDFQRRTMDFFAHVQGVADTDPEPGLDGILRGMISRQYPNLLSQGDYPHDRMTYLNRELDLFKAHVGSGLSPRMSLDMVRFLTYSHLANKRLATLPVGRNSRSVLVAMSGPLLSYYLGRPRNLLDASVPKREVYDLCRRLAGETYRKLRAGPTVDEVKTLSMAAMQKMVRDHLAYLNPETSRVLAAVTDAETRSYVTQVYESLWAVLQDGDADQITTFQWGRCLRVLNLELIMENAAIAGIDGTEDSKAIV